MCVAVTDTPQIEMSFNLSHYQPQLASSAPVYQTIFLDRASSALWTVAGIDPKKILLEKWWRQFAHTWSHFAFVVPFVQFIQGKQRTYYTGSWTLVNTHEIAIISGLAAAHRLGAEYPFGYDPLAAEQFHTYLSVVHGVLSLKTKLTALVGVLVAAFVLWRLLC